MPIPTATAATQRVLHAAAGMAAAPLLRGPDRTGVVVASTTDVIAVHVGAADPGLICLTSHDAVRLPCAMVLAEALPEASVGASVSVGDGRLQLPDTVVTTSRWRPAPPLPVSDPATCSARAAQCPAPLLDPGLRDAAATLACALRSPALQLDHAAGALLGLGPGLTPIGDDVLAGALVALRAARSPMATRLARAIEGCEPLSRTSTFSAGLLSYAARGQCVPQLAAFLAALSAPGSPTQAAGAAADPASVSPVSTARRQLLTVGHTSGAGLYTGVLCALRGPGSLVPGRSRP